MSQTGPIPTLPALLPVSGVAQLKAVDLVQAQTESLLAVTSVVAVTQSGLPVALSAEAQQLNSYLLQAQVDDGAPTAVTETLPLIHEGVHSAELADSLAKTLSQSGLFYESHLGQWVEGERSLDQIKQEPQNQLGTDTPALVSKQMDVLDQKMVTWTGPVWPGQHMSWTSWIDPEDANQQHSQSKSSKAHASPVHSHLVLSLPNLGTINARFSLRDQRLKIKLNVGNPKALVRLESKLSELASAIRKSGQALDGLQLEASDTAT